MAKRHPRVHTEDQEALAAVEQALKEKPSDAVGSNVEVVVLGPNGVWLNDLGREPPLLRRCALKERVVVAEDDARAGESNGTIVRVG